MKTGRLFFGVLAPAACLVLSSVVLPGQDEGETRGIPAQVGKAVKAAREKNDAEPATWDGSELAPAKYGTLLVGPDAETEMFRDNVVIVHFWHPEDTGSVGALSGLKRFHEANHAAGLAVIANDYSNLKEKAYSAVKNLKPPFPVVTGMTLPPPAILKGKDAAKKDGKQMATILYDHTGTAKAVFHSFNQEARNLALKLLKSRPHPLLGSRNYGKILPAVNLVRADRYGAALTYCKEKAEAEKPDADAKAEAAFLQKNLEQYAERITRLAAEKQQQWPSQTTKLLADIQRLYAGSSFAEEAAKQLGDLRKDKPFLLSLRSEKEYVQIRTAVAGIPPCPVVPADKRKWMTKYSRQVQDLTKLAAAMKRNYGDNWHTQQAENMLANLAMN